ncbi:MAG: methylcrotonoyl-CoA carboxylase, partial [Porticoccaceae bacterium]|nr:methylcrotonoyl-CoA carboxylase [Porticoccaceae bacterium]
MAILQTKIKVKSTQFAANAKAMQAKVDDLNQTLESIAKGGGTNSCERHVSRGKLLPRDRILGLLDQDT